MIETRPTFTAERLAPACDLCDANDTRARSLLTNVDLYICAECLRRALQQLDQCVPVDCPACGGAGEVVACIDTAWHRQPCVEPICTDVCDVCSGSGELNVRPPEHPPAPASPAGQASGDHGATAAKASSLGIYAKPRPIPDPHDEPATRMPCRSSENVWLGDALVDAATLPQDDQAVVAFWAGFATATLPRRECQDSAPQASPALDTSPRDASSSDAIDAVERRVPLCATCLEGPTPPLCAVCGGLERESLTELFRRGMCYCTDKRGPGDSPEKPACENCMRQVAQAVLVTDAARPDGRYHTAVCCSPSCAAMYRRWR